MYIQRGTFRGNARVEEKKVEKKKGAGREREREKER